MNIEYDEDVDAAFVWIASRPDDRSKMFVNELWPEELKGKIGLLFDADRRLVGLEVLEASTHLPRASLGGLDA